MTVLANTFEMYFTLVNTTGKRICLGFLTSRVSVVLLKFSTHFLFQKSFDDVIITELFKIYIVFFDDIQTFLPSVETFFQILSRFNALKNMLFLFSIFLIRPMPSTCCVLLSV